MDVANLMPLLSSMERFFKSLKNRMDHQQVIVHLLKLKMRLLNTLLDITARLGLTAIMEG